MRCRPVSNKGSLLRFQVEKDNKEVMDEMDSRLLGDKSGANTTTSAVDGGGDCDGGGSMDDPDDSLSRAMYSGGKRSAEHTRLAHLCWLCMLGIVLHHVTFFGGYVKGPAKWLVSVCALMTTRPWC